MSLLLGTISLSLDIMYFGLNVENIKIKVK